MTKSRKLRARMPVSAHDVQCICNRKVGSWIRRRHLLFVVGGAGCLGREQLPFEPEGGDGQSSDEWISERAPFTPISQLSQRNRKAMARVTQESSEYTLDGD
jgi:hypothetical protein